MEVSSSSSSSRRSVVPHLVVSGSWSALVVNIVRTLGASLERDAEIDAVFPGQYMIDAFKRNLSVCRETHLRFIEHALVS